MPELPDIVVYIEALESRVLGQGLERIRIASPFLVRSFDPPVAAAEKKRVWGFRRLGKRIVFCLEDDLFLVLHLMIAGRLQWQKPGASHPRRTGLAAFDFGTGSLLLTEAGTKRRASLHVVRGETELAAHDPGGMELLDCTAEAFERQLRSEVHTLKRALTDPRLFSGIGNAYSDEILHAAGLSPLKRTDQVDSAEVARLHNAVQKVLRSWLERLRSEYGAEFPAKVTAFREGMAVHGRHRQPCPRCGAAVQRIVYADNETNYCPVCQTGGRVLADRSLSRLLREDWPRSLEELDRIYARRKP